MDDEKDIVGDPQNGDCKDTVMKNVGVQNQEFANMQETQNVNNDLSCAKGEGVGNEIQSLVVTGETYGEEDSEQPGFSPPEEERSLGPSVTTSPPVPETAGNRNELHIDLPIEVDSVKPSETFLETQAKGETESKSNEMELDRKSGTREDSNGEEAPMESFLESERNGETSNNEVNLTFEGERREEKLISSSNGLEFHRDTKSKDNDFGNVVTKSELPVDYGRGELTRSATVKEELDENEIKEELPVNELDEGDAMEFNSVNNSFLLGPGATEDEETGMLEEQVAFVKELEIFHKERRLDFRPPRFYQEPLNLLKLWRSVVRLGGYEQVTSCKLWRQIGESFKPPKTCTTVSWTFRCFYEKALLEYEKHKLRCGELPYTDASFPDHIGAGTPLLAIGSGRQRRDAAARAMQGWHSQRLLGNGEVGDPIIKDKNSTSTPKRERPLKSIGLQKRKKPSPVERTVNVVHMKESNLQSEADVIDIGHPADWVKINVQRTKDCFEVYALVPGLLREEVRVQSDAVGRLVISGQPEQMDDPWGVTPFRKVVSLPSRIDPHQTSAVVTLHGQLFVRVPFDPLDI